MIFKVTPIFILFTFACGLAVNHKYSNDNENKNYYSGPAKQYQENPSENYHSEEEQYEDAYPKYEFKYAVNDDHSGDSKSQHEVRDGDKVRGVYTLADTDGYQRIVEYTADDKEGFIAVVRREPIAGFKPPPQIQEHNQQYYENYLAKPQQGEHSHSNHKQQYESYTVKPQPTQQSQSNHQQQYESYTVKAQPAKQSQTNHQQQYESYTVKAQPAQQSQGNNNQQYESYSVTTRQPEQIHQDYNSAQNQKYPQPAQQAGSGYEKSQEGSYVIKYSTSAPEIVTAAPEHKYQYVAPAVLKANQNQNVAISHVNNYFETPGKTEEYNSASEYPYGYDY